MIFNFLKRKCKITFIRHGATINSEENRLFDDENYPPLNNDGIVEIQKIANWVKQKGLKVDKIYTSPALRTIQSAEIISKTVKQNFEIIPGLIGRKYGIWSGLTFEQIEEKYPDMLAEYHKNPVTYSPEGAEALNNLNQRVQETLNAIIDKNIGKRLIVITHDEVIQAAVRNILDIPVQNQLKIYIPTGSATQISYFTDWGSLLYCGYVPV